MTTVNGEYDFPVCLDDNLGIEDQGKEQDEEAKLLLEDIQLFLESRGHLQDAMQVGNFMDNLSAVQIATANRPLFMISFNSNSSLFRVSFNFVNTSKKREPPRWDQPLNKDRTSRPQCSHSSEVSLYIKYIISMCYPSCHHIFTGVLSL